MDLNKKTMKKTTGTKKLTETSKKSVDKPKKTTETSKKSVKKMKGGEYMEIYTDTSPGWHNDNSPTPYAVNLDVGINEYMFGRTTPDNKFVVSTGLENNCTGIKMVGGKKKNNL